MNIYEIGIGACGQGHMSCFCHSYFICMSRVFISISYLVWNQYEQIWHKYEITIWIMICWLVQMLLCQFHTFCICRITCVQYLLYIVGPGAFWGPQHMKNIWSYIENNMIWTYLQYLHSYFIWFSYFLSYLFHIFWKCQFRAYGSHMLILMLSLDSLGTLK